MSNNKPPKKKKVVVTTNKKQENQNQPKKVNQNKGESKGKKNVKPASKESRKKVTPTVSSRSRSRGGSEVSAQPELIFGRQNYAWMGLGLGLVVLGLILMSGGHMPSPDVWDESLIYSFRRTVLAPIVILSGLGVEIYAIFKR